MSIRNSPTGALPGWCPQNPPLGADPRIAGVSHDEEIVEGPPEEPSEEELQRREAALSQVISFGDPILRSRASEVHEFGPQLRQEAERMVQIMRDAMGVGLAATQLGVLRRMLVFQAGPDATPSLLVNPLIEWASGELATATEGCLSLPRVVVDVERPLHVRATGCDASGEPVTIEASGLEARILQHEIDHLDGVLVLDRTERAQRKGAMRALREGTSFAPVSDEDEEDAGADRVNEGDRAGVSEGS